MWQVAAGAVGHGVDFPALSDRMMRPFVALGGRLQQHADQQPALKVRLVAGCGGRVFMGTLCRTDFWDGVGGRGIEWRKSV